MSKSRFAFGNPNAQTPKRPDEVAPENLDTPSRLQRQNLHVRLPRQLLKKLKVHCAITGVSQQDVISQGIELVLQLFGNPNAQTPSIMMIDHDDLKSDDDIVQTTSSSHSEAGNPNAQTRESALLGFYAEQTGNRIRERDRAVLSQIAHCSDNAIKAGILRSIIFCQTQVHSLRYCVGAVLEIHEAGAAVSGEYVRYLLARLPAQHLYKRQQENLPGFGGDVADITKRGK